MRTPVGLAKLATMTGFLQVRLRGLALCWLALVELLAFLFALTVLAATFCLGLGWFVLAPTLGLSRRLATLARRHARDWSGVQIAEPYNPGPPFPTRQPDGWYRHGRRLYRSPLFPAYNLRTLWMYGDPATWRDLLWTLLDPIVGGTLALLCVVFGAGPLRVHARWTGLLLAPTAGARLGRRVQELTEMRTEATDAQAAELRRIERDLHDGTQARLVALGMTVGAAEDLVDDDPSAAKALLAKTRESSAKALAELRGLVRGIYPPVLADRGLADAVRALALDSPLDVDVRVDLRRRPPAPVESVVYFAVSEALANAATHAGADRVWIDLRHERRRLVASVTDDGHGGADPARGTGLHGIERRLAPFDGVLTVSSPEGGPTAVSMELPTAPIDTTGSGIDSLSRSDLAGIIGVGLGSIALWPQGVVPLIITLTDGSTRSWFLARHLPEPFQVPVAAVMIAVGVVGYVLTARHFKKRKAECD